MIYGFAKQSGGQVRIRSEVGAGTTVCLYLPRHRGEAETDGPGPRKRQMPQADAGASVSRLARTANRLNCVQSNSDELGFR